MADVKISVNYAGVGEMLKSAEMANLLKECAPMAAQYIGKDADSVNQDEYTGTTRVNVSLGG